MSHAVSNASLSCGTLGVCSLFASDTISVIGLFNDMFEYVNGNS